MSFKIRKIHIYTNKKEESESLAKDLRTILEKMGFEIKDDYDSSCDMVVTIGGDGTFLRAVHEFSFPPCIFAGINTGHLGFFQDLNLKELEAFAESVEQMDYTTSSIVPLKATVRAEDKSIQIRSINEVAIKNDKGRTLHLGLYISGEMMERFSGDGIIISTSAGSTAYNYSSGGAIIDSRLNLIQVMPICPLNTNAYRCITSGIILPSDQKIMARIDEDVAEDAQIIVDGMIMELDRVLAVEISSSLEDTIRVFRMKDYNFWKKVREKFL